MPLKSTVKGITNIKSSNKPRKQPLNNHALHTLRHRRPYCCQRVCLRIHSNRGRALQLLTRHSALAGQNCKCQARNGQGPQNNAATQRCCTDSVNRDCIASWLPSFPGPNNQVCIKRTYSFLGFADVYVVFCRWNQLPQLGCFCRCVHWWRRCE
jgi:hypothetical protein